jgi:hypothetical protein
MCRVNLVKDEKIKVAEILKEANEESKEESFIR